ncbi:hypothetical protein [Lysobacter gummosus]
MGVRVPPGVPLDTEPVRTTRRLECIERAAQGWAGFREESPRE